PDPPVSEMSEPPAPWMYGGPVLFAARRFSIMSGSPSPHVVDPSATGLLPGQVKMTKAAVPVAGKVNEWEVTLRVEGRPLQVTSDIVLVIDISGSMSSAVSGKSRLAWAKDAANNFVNTVLTADPVNTRIAVVAYSNNVTTVRDLTNDKSQLNAGINGLTTENLTHTQIGIRQARLLLGSSSAAKKSIVLLSDGLPNLNAAIYSPTQADFYTGSQVTDRVSRKDLAESRFNYGSTVSSSTSVYISGTQYRYSSPNSTIAEGAIARAYGYNLYAIGMYAGTAGQATLNETAPGKAYASDAAGLDSVFQSIAGQLGSPVSSASVTDPMDSGFIIADTGTITNTSGTADYDDVTDTLTWTFPFLSQVLSGDTRFETLTYRIVITDDTPVVSGIDTLPTNDVAAMSFTDVDGNSALNNFPIPQVDPVFVTLDKILLDVNGDPVDSTEPFTVDIGGTDHAVTPNDPIKVIKKVWTVGEHDVSEDPSDPPYITSMTVNGLPAGGSPTVKINMSQGGPDQDVV
ncbi:MAG TPA: VWA domain-containing protein, partial [Candidatus Moranbacteria bacterium]|nr:VWA domain-containing protein [Candidatus Moranbacteria bacterium]